jgi:multiple sugar transport system substrate-binding protein
LITRLINRLKADKYFYTVIIILIVIAFVLVNSFLNSSDISTKNSVVTIYYVDHISRAHRKVIDRFNEKYAGQIHVEAINLPFDKFSTNERKELLARYLKSKSDRIDVFAVDQIWVPRFAKWGVALNKYFPKEETDQLLDKAMESCYYRDSLAALPLYIDIGITIARKDILLKYPNGQKLVEELENGITWERLIKLHSEMGLRNPFYEFQAQDYEGLNCLFTELVASQGGSYVSGDSLNLVGNPAVKKAAQLLVDLVNKYHISPKEVVDFQENESFRHFISNNGVFVRAWPSVYGNDDKVFPGFSAVRPNLIQVPNPYFEGQKQVAIFGGWNLMVAKNTQKLPEVIKFLKFVLSEESQKAMFEDGLYLPVLNQVYQDSNFTKRYPNLKFFRQYIRHGVHRPFLKDYTAMSDVLTYYLHAAIKKEMSVDQALKLAAEKLHTNHLLLK